MTGNGKKKTTYQNGDDRGRFIIVLPTLHGFTMWKITIGCGFYNGFTMVLP